MSRFYYVSFSVVGTYLFPTDMLRHDQCFPADTTSALVVSEQRVSKEPRVVHCALYSQNKYAYPTIDRWRSFGWTVDESSIKREIAA